MLQKRIAAYLIDGVIILAPLFVLSIAYVLFEEQIDYSLVCLKKRIFYALYFVSLVYCLVGPVFKDVFGKRSIGKRIAGLKIVSLDGTKPSFIQLVIRNIFVFLWPIEAIFLLLGKKRLGDIFAKTKVVFAENI